MRITFISRCLVNCPVMGILSFTAAEVVPLKIHFQHVQRRSSITSGSEQGHFGIGLRLDQPRLQPELLFLIVEQFQLRPADRFIFIRKHGGFYKRRMGVNRRARKHFQHFDGRFAVCLVFDDALRHFEQLSFQHIHIAVGGNAIGGLGGYFADIVFQVGFVSSMMRMFSSISKAVKNMYSPSTGVGTGLPPLSGFRCWW